MFSVWTTNSFIFSQIKWNFVKSLGIQINNRHTAHKVLSCWVSNNKMSVRQIQQCQVWRLLFANTLFQQTCNNNRTTMTIRDAAIEVTFQKLMINIKFVNFDLKCYTQSSLHYFTLFNFKQFSHRGFRRSLPDV